MSGPYAVGKHAFGFCDRCGFRYPLVELKNEVIALQETSLKVCPECWDPDNPQNNLGRFTFDDAQALRNPRPPLGLVESRYGDAIRNDFLLGTVTNEPRNAIEGWFYNTAPFGETTSWNSADKTIYCDNQGDVENTSAGLVNYEYYSGGGGLSVDASVYKFVRVRMRIVDRGTDTQDNAWDGAFRWYIGDPSIYLETPFDQNPPRFVPSPDFNAMGDPWHIITWDMRNVSDWAGTVTGASFDFFEYTSTTTTKKLIEVDYIRFETD